jgi:hypothetical protein
MCVCARTRVGLWEWERFNRSTIIISMFSLINPVLKWKEKNHHQRSIMSNGVGDDQPNEKYRYLRDPDIYKRVNYFNFRSCLDWNAVQEFSLCYFSPPENYPCKENLLNGLLHQKCVMYTDLNIVVARTHA